MANNTLQACSTAQAIQAIVMFINRSKCWLLNISYFVFCWQCYIQTFSRVFSAKYKRKKSVYKCQRNSNHLQHPVLEYLSHSGIYTSFVYIFLCICLSVCTFFSSLALIICFSCDNQNSQSHYIASRRSQEGLCSKICQTWVDFFSHIMVCIAILCVERNEGLTYKQIWTETLKNLCLIRVWWHGKWREQDRVLHKVYHDSELQCVVERHMGQFAMRCMLSCMTRATHRPYLCVGSTAPSLDILLFAINLMHGWVI